MTCAAAIWRTRRRSTPRSRPALDSGWYILGEQAAAFEVEFGAYCRAAVCAGVNSGTDAIHSALRACAIGLGDEVITVAHTAVATVAAIRLAGATPVLVDIDPQTYTLDPQAFEDAITPATRAVLPVGLPCETPPICRPFGRSRAAVAVADQDAPRRTARRLTASRGRGGDLALLLVLPYQEPGRAGRRRRRGRPGPRPARTCAAAARDGRVVQERYVSQIEGVNSRLDECKRRRCACGCAIWTRKTRRGGSGRRSMTSCCRRPWCARLNCRAASTSITSTWCASLPAWPTVAICAANAGRGHRDGHPLPGSHPSPARLCRRAGAAACGRLPTGC